MSQGNRITLLTVTVVICIAAVLLLVTLTSATAAGARSGTSMPTVQPVHPQAEPVPDKGAVTSTHIFKDVTQSFPFANPCTGAPGRSPSPLAASCTSPP